MRKIKGIFLLVCCLWSGLAFSATNIRLDNDIYVLQDVSEAPLVEGGYLNQYIRQFETPDNWTKMIVVQSYPYISDAASGVAFHIKKSYQNNPNAVMGNIVYSKTTATLPFAMFNIKDGKNIYENNVIRFYNTKNGVVSMQYIELVPLEDIKQAKKMLMVMKKKQNSVIEMFNHMEVPVVLKEIKK